MTNEQEIRAAAATAVFGQAKNPILVLREDLTDRELSSQDELRAVEEYIRHGLEGPGKGYVTTEDLRNRR